MEVNMCVFSQNTALNTALALDFHHHHPKNGGMMNSCFGADFSTPLPPHHQEVMLYWGNMTRRHHNIRIPQPYTLDNIACPHQLLAHHLFQTSYHKTDRTYPKQKNRRGFWVLWGWLLLVGWLDAGISGILDGIINIVECFRFRTVYIYENGHFSTQLRMRG